MNKVTKFTKKVKGQVNNSFLAKTSWVVGIDIGKKRISCAIMKKDRTFLCRFNTEASIDGYKKILMRTKEKTKNRGKVVYAMEPTGHYWMILGQFFEDNNQQYVLIHPLVVARSREVARLNRGKTDHMDARLIGELACRGIVTRTQIPEDYWATLRFLQSETIGLRAGRNAMFCRIINSMERLEVAEKQQNTTEQSLLAYYNQSEYKKYLNSVQGTTPTTNALILGFLGNPTSYDNPKTLIKLAGCDPVLNESGKYHGKTHISHRGRSLLRKAADRTAFSIEKRNVIFRNFFHHLVTRQKNKLTKRQARIACINKYFRIIWVLCNHRVKFNPSLA